MRTSGVATVSVSLSLLLVLLVLLVAGNVAAEATCGSSALGTTPTCSADWQCFHGGCVDGFCTGEPSWSDKARAEFVKGRLGCACVSDADCLGFDPPGHPINQTSSEFRWFDAGLNTIMAGAYCNGFTSKCEQVPLLERCTVHADCGYPTSGMACYELYRNGMAPLGAKRCQPAHKPTGAPCWYDEECGTDVLSSCDFALPPSTSPASFGTCNNAGSMPFDCDADQFWNPDTLACEPKIPPTFPGDSCTTSCCYSNDMCQGGVTTVCGMAMDHNVPDSEIGVCINRTEVALPELSPCFDGYQCGPGMSCEYEPAEDGFVCLPQKPQDYCYDNNDCGLSPFAQCACPVMDGAPVSGLDAIDVSPRCVSYADNRPSDACNFEYGVLETCMRDAAASECGGDLDLASHPSQILPGAGNGCARGCAGLYMSYQCCERNQILARADESQLWMVDVYDMFYDCSDFTLANVTSPGCSDPNCDVGSTFMSGSGCGDCASSNGNAAVTNGMPCNLDLCVGVGNSNSAPGCINGQCFGVKSCQCNGAWEGDACDLDACDNQCDRGQCVGPDTCLCDEGWGGAYCSSLSADSSLAAGLNGFTIFGVVSGAAAMVCYVRKLSKRSRELEAETFEGIDESQIKVMVEEQLALEEEEKQEKKEQKSSKNKKNTSSPAAES